MNSETIAFITLCLIGVLILFVFVKAFFHVVMFLFDYAFTILVILVALLLLIVGV
jgi:hypothetical protein